MNTKLIRQIVLTVTWTELKICSSTEEWVRDVEEYLAAKANGSESSHYSKGSHPNCPRHRSWEGTGTGKLRCIGAKLLVLGARWRPQPDIVRWAFNNGCCAPISAMPHGMGSQPLTA